MNVINFGSLNIDYVFQVKEIVQPGQTIDSQQVNCFPGGKGLNQSIAFSRAGGHIFHAGMIGEDGLFLKDLLEKNQVDCRYIHVLENAGTGKAFIQVDQKGQNSIVLNGGANRMSSIEYITEVLSNFSAGDWLLLQNEISCVEHLITIAERRQMRIVLNPSPMNEQILDYPLSKVNLFLLNEDEGKRLTGGETPDEVLALMADKYPHAEVILTLGDKGAFWSNGEKHVYQKSFSVEPIDTTGAGDTFTGYVLACMSRNEEIETCMYKAAKAAAIAVTRKGAASSIPYERELKAEFGVESE